MKYLTVKRAIDFVFGSLLFVVALPLMIVAMFCVWVEDASQPPIFIQKRYGKNFKVFNIYKIRTMKGSAAQEQDEIDRVLKVGEILRKTSIDELPQLLNIIRGEMSFIGPRPLPLQSFNKPFIKDEILRHNTSPGITGKAQIQGGNTIFRKEKFKLDIAYIDSMSFSQDMQICFETIKTLLLLKRPNSREYLKFNDQT